MPTFPLARLDHFRTELHACFPRRADALFELGDALLCAQAIPSLPHLSLEPVHQRGWGSVYAALARGEVDAERLRDLLADSLPATDPPVFAVDVTTWPRCDAECSPERGYYYHPSRHSAGQPIIAGWAYQWIAQVSFDRDSWTAPVDARRLHPLEDTDQTAAAQIQALLERLPAKGAAPLFVFDGGYDSAQLTLDLANAPAAVLVRLRSDRCFYADPPPAARSPKGGRPRRHGAKFNCADPTTWPAPTATLTRQDDQYGTVTVACWAGLHPKQQRHPGHGSRRPRPIVRGTVIRVQVQRIPAKTRPPKVLWLWWAGPYGYEPDLDLVWRAYVRRFDLEHTVRFCKQTLGWTIPRPRHPEQADRWTWLIMAGYTQLRLARQVAGDQRLPWERPRPRPRLSPVRVRRGFPQLLVRLGSPASAPKPAGCPPGRPKGRCSGPARRYPAIKKPIRRPHKKTTKAAKTA
ncbi:MAG TPA: NF041680 family putative transposase [Actinomycetes bacterium]|nr:NF041680 family putative transposase [Actinomycetes bacterium]